MAFHIVDSSWLWLAQGATQFGCETAIGYLSMLHDASVGWTMGDFLTYLDITKPYKEYNASPNIHE